MGTRAIPAGDGGARERYGLADAQSQVARTSRYRLHVLTPGVLDAVRFAGGWIFDQVKAGWTVSVVVPDHPDERPLRILGADMLDLQSVLVTADTQPRPAALAVAAELYEQDERIKQLVRNILEHARPELITWGEPWPADLRQNRKAVEHRLSSAAYAFKAHALRAASAEPKVVATETFYAATPSVTLGTGLV
jgi:hypothetical protein